jgi:carbon starvation protein
MPLLPLIAGCALILILAYLVYGRLVMKWLGIDDARPTPATQLNDGNDYCPAPAGVVLGGHFTAIAAAGPIVGPILAGLAFGWLPALLWIISGAIFVGAVHDSGALFASVRHKAGSITQVVKANMSKTAYTVFLLFIWLSLIYVIIAFAALTAASFSKTSSIPAVIDGQPTTLGISGGAVVIGATAYLLMSILLGVLLKYVKLHWSIGLAVSVIVLGVVIAVSPALASTLSTQFPAIFAFLDTATTGSSTTGNSTVAWSMALIVYCFVASITPMWLLLQPRGLIGATFLYATLVFGIVGCVIAYFTGQVDLRINTDRMFMGELAGTATLVFPFLFITIACGACSGFHSVVASGTTSKQVRKESDIKPIAFGAMLLEAMVAVLALSTVMVLATGAVKGSPAPDAIFAQGIAKFMSTLGIDLRFAMLFGLLAFSSFIFDTLDVCTRLGRYVLQELLGIKGVWAGALATMLTLAFPAIYLLGNDPDAWRKFWTVFGTSNQLLAALTLVGVAVWLGNSGRKTWYVILPAMFMLASTTAALVLNLRSFVGQWTALKPDQSLVPVMSNMIIAVVLLGLAVVVVGDALRVWVTSRKLKVAS